MPITIQEAITLNIRSFINEEDREKLDQFAYSRNRELHGVILESDEFPDMINKMNAIR